MKNYRVYLFVFVALLPVLFLRDFTPTNELRYLSIANEALRGGHLFAFYNHGLPYADKPPLYFWIIMLGKWIWGKHVMFFLSLFSLIPALIIAYIMEKWVKGEGRESFHDIRVLTLFTTGLFLGLAIFIRMDMLMCMFIVLSLYIFYRQYTDPEVPSFYSWLFPLYVFLGIFSKGPMGLIVPLSVIFVFLLINKQLNQFFRFWGWKTWTFLIIGCLLWFIGAYIEGGKDYIQNLLFHQTYDRAVNSFHHKEPFYYYLKTMWYSFAPWILLILFMIITVFKKGCQSSLLQRFFLTTAVTIFILLSVVSSKIEIYLLPAYPFLIYWTILRIESSKQHRLFLLLPITVPSVICVFSFPFFLYAINNLNLNYIDNPILYAASILLSLIGLCALYLLYVKKDIVNVIRILAIGILIVIHIGGYSLCTLNTQLGYGTICREAEKLGSQKQISDFVVWKMNRAENMDVYLNRPVRYVSEDDIKLGKLKNQILILPTKRVEEIQPFTKSDSIYTYGRYSMILF